MRIEAPGQGEINIVRLVLDFTGTLSIDGELIPGVAERLRELAETMDIYVLTADTFGKARQALDGLPVKVTILQGPEEDEKKREFVESLGADETAAMGNGNNDALMLKCARLGIAVLEREGCSAQALINADMVVKNIGDGLDLLLKPLRIKAGLRK